MQPDEVTMEDAVKLAREETGDACIPCFYQRAVLNNYRTRVEGRQCYDNKDFVQIIMPGDSRSVVDREVKEEDKRRWPGYWQRYQQGKEQTAEGTPIDNWPFLTPAQVQELKYLNFLTVEALAEAPDTAVERLGPGGRDLQNRAKQYTQRDSDTEKELRAEVERLQRRVAELEAPNVQEQKKRGPGRPRKEGGDADA